MIKEKWSFEGEECILDVRIKERANIDESISQKIVSDDDFRLSKINAYYMVLAIGGGYDPTK